MVFKVDETDRSLVLRLYGSAEDFRGEARTGEGEPRSFSSWIEMVGLIEGWQAEHQHTTKRGTAGAAKEDP